MSLERLIELQAKISELQEENETLKAELEIACKTLAENAEEHRQEMNKLAFELAQARVRKHER